MDRAGWMKLGLCLLLLAGIVWSLLGFDLGDLAPDRVRTLMLSFGAWAPIFYLLLYSQPIVPLPSSVFTTAGGLAFGPWWGLIAAMAGATTRACTQFWLARWLGRGAVATPRQGTIAALEQYLATHPVKAVALTRVIPNLPFDAQNFLLGVSRVRFLPYVVGTALGIMPSCVVFAYLGYSLGNTRQPWKLGVGVLLIVVLLIAQQLSTRQRARSPSAP